MRAETTDLGPDPPCPLAPLWTHESKARGGIHVVVGAPVQSQFMPVVKSLGG